MHTNKNLILLTLISIFSCLLIVSCNNSTFNSEIKGYEEYKIGVAAPQFGPYEALGLSIVHGAEIAVEEANNLGGIDGKKIKLIKIDDGGLAGEGTWKAKTLVSEMILGVIGHLNSDISIPASEIYAEAMIPQISPGSTSPLFTERKNVRGYVFRTIGRDDGQGKVVAKFIKQNGYKKIGILHNNRTYGESLASEFIKSLQTEGNCEIVFNSVYKVGKDNFAGEISKLKQNEPDFLFFIGEYGDASKFLREARLKEFQGIFLGSDGVFDKEFITNSTGKANGAYVISYPPIRNRDFATKYKERFDRDIGSFSASSYDATNILINAIKNTEKKVPSKVAQTIKSTKNYTGVANDITFDEKGDVINQPFFIYRVSGGEFIAIKQ